MRGVIIDILYNKYIITKTNEKGDKSYFTENPSSITAARLLYVIHFLLISSKLIKINYYEKYYDFTPNNCAHAQ